MSRRKQNEMARRARRWAGLAQDQLLGALSVSVPLLPPVAIDSEGQIMQSFGLRQNERWQVFSSFNLGGQRLCRGDYLSDAQAEELQRAVNYQQLRDSFLRPGTPPADWQPKNRQPLPPKKPLYPEPAKIPPAWLVDLAEKEKPGSWCWQLAEAILETKRPIGVAVDLVPSNLLTHGQADYALYQKPITGPGTYRRSIEHFHWFLMLVMDRVEAAALEKRS
jgi:hypothetical protein